MYIYSHNPHSQGARDLAQRLGIPRIRHNRPRFRGDSRKVVINWGASEVPEQIRFCTVINSPDNVKAASNKLDFFIMMSEETRIPSWTEDIVQAREWIRGGSVVVERHLLSASGGRGIRIVADEADLTAAPLYTKYIKKKDEYRVHIFRGDVFDIQRKGLREGVDEPNWRVRNHENGFIYMRQGLRVPAGVREHAIKAFNCTGLDFGAVDVIWNSNRRKAYVLEINTAPGLEGTTLDKYTEIFQNNL